MYIELVSKTSLWRGDMGVVLNIKARIYRLDPNLLSAVDAQNIRNAGLTMGITISGLGEVSTSELGQPIQYGAESMAVIQEWLTTNSLLSEWEEETSKYVSTLSRVDLPCPPDDVSGKYLQYQLKMGEVSVASLLMNRVVITVIVTVDYEGACISVGLRSGDDRNEHNSSIDLCDSTIKGPVTTDTVKAGVSKSLDKLWDLVELSLVQD